MTDLSKLSTAELKRKEKLLTRALGVQEARASLLRFTQLMFPDPQDPEDASRSIYDTQPHHRLVAAAVEEAFACKTQYTAISMPPQHGKSDLISRKGVAWFAGKWPTKNLIFGTYNQDFANEFGDDVRSIMLRPEYRQVFPYTEMRKGSKARDHMVTTKGGKLSFLGRGGSATGRPADLLIVDDPIKNAQEAESMASRNEVWQWYTQALDSRCHVNSSQIIVLTRWHEDDIIGRLTDPTNPFYDEQVARKWTVINIPAVMDNEEIAKALGRKVGEALWSARFPLDLLEDRRRKNPYAFHALYMGKPTPPEGAFYKLEHFKGYKSTSDLPQDMTYYIAGDLAVNPEKDNDKTAIGVVGVDSKDDLWLLPDLVWGRKSADKSVEDIIDMAERHAAVSFFIERGPVWRSIEPFMLKRMRERGAQFHIEDLPLTRGAQSVGHGPKAARSLPLRGRMMQGKVHLPMFAPWWPAAKDHLLKFTGSGTDKEDDLADMIALFGNGLALQMRGRAPDVAREGNVYKVGTWGHLRQSLQRDRQARKVRTVRAGW